MLAMHCVDSARKNAYSAIMAETTNLNIRMDRELKERAEVLFGEMGMNMTTAINVFIRQSLRDGKIPFEISLASVPEYSNDGMQAEAIPCPQGIAERCDLANRIFRNTSVLEYSNDGMQVEVIPCPARNYRTLRFCKPNIPEH